jgi:hypothetical protein
MLRLDGGSCHYERGEGSRESDQIPRLATLARDDNHDQKILARLG